MNLNSLLQSAIGQSFDVCLPEAARRLTTAGKTEVWDTLFDAGIVKFDSATYSYNVYHHDMWETVGSDFVTKDGKITRRIAKYLYKAGIKTDNATVKTTVKRDGQDKEIELPLISHLGNIIAKYLSAAGIPYRVSFRTDLWPNGKYGDGGACFLPGGMNEHIPDCIFAASGAGVTVDRRDSFDNRLIPFGRSWVSPSDRDGAIALYNWYDNNDSWNIQTLGHLLASGIGSPFYGAKFTEYKLVSDSGMHFNAKGSVLHAADWEKPYRSVYVPIEIVRFNTCRDCGDRLYDGDDYELNGRHYCADCYPAIECAHCNRDYLPEDITEVYDGDSICYLCLRSDYTECEKCGVYHPDENVTHINLPSGELTVCENCHSEFYSCDFCADGKGAILVEDSKRACVSCYADNFHLISVLPTPDQLSLSDILYSWRSYDARRADLIVYRRDGWQFYAA